MSTRAEELVKLDPWMVLARWTLGELTDDEYADYRELRDGPDDPASRIIVAHLRERGPA